MLLCMGLMVSLVPAQGAATQKVLKAKTTYNTTLTGIQKHKIKYTVTEVNSNDNALNLYIDGKKGNQTGQI